jgi:DNA-binding NtrC family response regulator
MPETTDDGSRATILVVDDEPDVRALIREVLTLNGYTVIDTGDPFEARRIAERQPIQLLLTDVVMPIMNGIELAQRVEAVSPTTKVLLMSGYVTAAVKTSGRPLLSKPFRTNDLLAAVRQMLDSRSAFGVHPRPRPGRGSGRSGAPPGPSAPGADYLGRCDGS